MNTITVYYTKISSSDTFSNYGSHFVQLPSFLCDKIIRLKNKSSQVAKLFGLLLLQKALEQSGFSKKELSKIEYGENGKPFIKDAIAFNISHSHDMVICACSTSAIGIDVEKIRSIKIEHFIPYLSNVEFRALHNSEKLAEDFFELWTKKEAFVKAIGDGMNIPFPQIEIEANKIEYMQQVWYTQPLLIESNYTVHICTKMQELKVDMKRIDI